MSFSAFFFLQGTGMGPPGATCMKNLKTCGPGKFSKLNLIPKTSISVQPFPHNGLNGPFGPLINIILKKISEIVKEGGVCQKVLKSALSDVIHFWILFKSRNPRCTYWFPASKFEQCVLHVVWNNIRWTRILTPWCWPFIANNIELIRGHPERTYYQVRWDRWAAQWGQSKATFILTVTS